MPLSFIRKEGKWSFEGRQIGLPFSNSYFLPDFYCLKFADVKTGAASGAHILVQDYRLFLAHEGNRFYRASFDTKPASGAVLRHYEIANERPAYSSGAFPVHNMSHIFISEILQSA